MSNSATIRLNRDIQYIMFHQSEHFSNSVRGIDINKSCVQDGLFGIPQDIVINVDGKIDLSPRWIRAENSNHMEQDVPLYQIFKYPIHDISDSCVFQDMNNLAIHLLVIGNFNNTVPTAAQITTITKLLFQIIKKLPTISDILYHSDIVSTDCPGILFPPKQHWYDLFQ